MIEIVCIDYHAICLFAVDPRVRASPTHFIADVWVMGGEGGRHLLIELPFYRVVCFGLSTVFVNDQKEQYQDYLEV